MEFQTGVPSKTEFFRNLNWSVLAKLAFQPTIIGYLKTQPPSGKLSGAALNTTSWQTFSQVSKANPSPTSVTIRHVISSKELIKVENLS
jgi:hypothetical protein